MKSKWFWIAVSTIVVINLGSVGTLAWLRTRDSQAFEQPCQVHTYGETNYTVQLLETAVGRVETGCVVIVSLRLTNPNPFDVTLHRDWFVLLDHEKEYYEPTQLGTIKIPAHGSIDREAFGFVVTDEALAGLLALKVGQQYFMTVKSPRPYRPPTKPGRFVSFHQRDW